MTNARCPQCGLINWPDAEACKRCGASLVQFSESKPAVLTWYRAYCVLMVLLYLFCVVVGIVFMVAAPADSDVSATEARLMGAFMFFIGIPCTATFLIGVFMPQKPWAWIYGLVLICIGLTSICCLPVTVPLLIHWIKPETKFYFGRT